MEKLEGPHPEPAAPRRQRKIFYQILCGVAVLCLLALNADPENRVQSSFRRIIEDRLFDNPLICNYKCRARHLLRHHPLIDGHNDLAIKIRGEFGNHIYASNFTEPFERGGLEGNLDLPRMVVGQYNAFMSAFWLCPADPMDFSDDAYDGIVRNTLQQIDVIKRLGVQYPKFFPETKTVKQAEKNFNRGEHIAPIIIEGLHQIGNSFANLRLMYEIGVRYATLNWNCVGLFQHKCSIFHLCFSLSPIGGTSQLSLISWGQLMFMRRPSTSKVLIDGMLTTQQHNSYADAALLTYLANFTTIPAPPLHGGISLEGRRVIREMNRLGMIVDLSHVSGDTMRDALIGQHNLDYPLPDHPDAEETDCGTFAEGGAWMLHRWQGSLSPPIMSHSSVFAICPHPRNVPDDVLEMVRQRRGVVMINFNPEFISCQYEDGQDPRKELPKTDMEGATLEKVADHIQYIGQMVGYEYAGIGSDFDGIEATPTGLDGVDKMPDLIAELLKRGVSEKHVIGIAGGNVLRVWNEVEETAEEMRRRGVKPAEDELKRIGALGL